MHRAESYPDEAALHRQLAIEAHRSAWSLLTRADRSEAEDAAMLTAAHASAWHWQEAGAGAQWQRAAWLIARVSIELGQAGAGLLFAQRTLALTAEHRQTLEDFDLAFAEEIAARAAALAGRAGETAAHAAEAARLGAGIADSEDRSVFFDQFLAGPWFGFEPASYRPAG